MEFKFEVRLVNGVWDEVSELQAKQYHTHGAKVRRVALHDATRRGFPVQNHIEVDLPANWGCKRGRNGEVLK